MGDEKLQESKKWLHYLSTGAKGINELEALTLIGLQVLNAHKGFFRCNFIVPDHLSDQDGNWHVGAIATMIDDVGAAAVYSTVGLAKTVDITLSYYSRVKIREEVELVADIVGDMGKLICVVVKVTRKENGEMVALGKQWMASFSPKTKLSQISKRRRTNCSKRLSSLMLQEPPNKLESRNQHFGFKTPTGHRYAHSFSHKFHMVVSWLFEVGIALSTTRLCWKFSTYSPSM